MKTIPENFRVKVTAWGPPSDRGWCCRVEAGPLVFAATAAEVDALVEVTWAYAFTDISRTVRAYPWSLTVFGGVEAGPHETTQTCDVVAHTLGIDVPHLFRVVKTRVLDAAARAAALQEETFDFSQVLDARRFQRNAVGVPKLGIMELISTFQPRLELAYGYKSAPDWRRAWAVSLAPFRGMKPEAWADLRHFLGQRVLKGTDLVRPAGPGELGFRMGGLHGAIICRGDDWSSHT